MDTLRCIFMARVTSRDNKASHRMNPAIRDPDRRSATAERVDSSSVLVAKAAVQRVTVAIAQTGDNVQPRERPAPAQTAGSR